MPISSRAAWPVWSFSLESKSTLPLAELSAKPKFEAGLVIQPCTTEVTSNVT
jgi:hypothetical protein